jgi:hypothetical protein
MGKRENRLLGGAGCGRRKPRRASQEDRTPSFVGNAVGKRQETRQTTDAPALLLNEEDALYPGRKWNEAGRLCKMALEAKPDDFDALSKLKLAESLRVHARALEDTGARGTLERKLAFLRLAGEKRAVVGESPPSALVVDYRVPRPDRDSGSVRMVALMRLLVSLGYRVTFLAQSAEVPAAHVASLRRAGITVRGRPQVRGVPHELTLRGTQYHLILISRYHVAEQSVSEVRRCAPQAVLVFDTVDLHYVRMKRRAERRAHPQQVLAETRQRILHLGTIEPVARGR